MPAPAATGPIRLFVYGTLLGEPQLVAVTGRTFARRPATLAGFVRIAPAGGYPYVVPRPGASVDGMLLEGLDADALAALDAYEDEGRLYVRQRVTVSADGRAIPCEVYVGRDVAR